MVVANPIYDTVFKYLMEDERIARTILSALLKRDTVKVDVRPHESNTKRDTLSVFRIDFAATVRESDGNEQPVTKGIPDAFVDSLTHDSIIVQIPRLHGIINNRLDEVLSIFDQSRINSENQHVLDLDDSVYAEDDIEMQRILRRLLMAASDIGRMHNWCK